MSRIARFGVTTLTLLVLGRTAAAQQTTAPGDAQAPAANDTIAAASPAASQTPAAGDADLAPAPKISPEAAAAKQKFDAPLAKWNELVKQMAQLRKDRANADASATGPVDEKLAGLSRDANQVLDEVVDAALALYRIDGQSFPEINSTLLYVAQYFVTGDPHGDGGDQFEKALPLLKNLLDAGAGDKWPQLWTLAGVSAYMTSDFAAAQEYLEQARQNGALGDAPPTSNPADPRYRVYELATQAEANLPALRDAWAKEQSLRAAEAKADNLPRVKLTTTKGDIVIELFEDQAPQAVANFLTLVKRGFYKDVPFHRVLPGFMAQGGDPTGSGSGGPGYSIRCECYRPDFRHHFRGSLSMAHAGRDTGGSQFFLTFVPTSFLDGRHTAFGRVIEGMDVMTSLKRRDPEAPLGSPDKIVTAKVLRDRGHEYTFEKLPGR